jgi:acetyl esterase/lipase
MNRAAAAAILGIVSDGPARVLEFPAAGSAVELRHLRSFVAVAEELNFGRAADRLYITQPALSRQITGLEQAIGCELLRRTTRRVELTLAGEALLERARRLLRDADEAVLAVQALSGEIVARVAQLWRPVGDQSDLEHQRAAYERMLARFEVPPGVEVRPVNAGGVPALLLGEDPESPPGILYLHGGGFVMGSAFGARPLAGALASATGRGVLTADYRLAPEHPFPAALDDAYAAYEWMVARSGVPSRLVVAGDSAGAGLALALLVRLRDAGLPLPAGATLFCPIADLQATTIAPHKDDLTSRVIGEFWRGCVEAYLAGHPPDDPLVSPVNGSLCGLPPLLIQAGTGDILRGESEKVAERARDDGVEARLELYPVDAHIFHHFWSFLPEAADALDAAGRFVREIVGGHSPPRGAGLLGVQVIDG